MRAVARILSVIRALLLAPALHGCTGNIVDSTTNASLAEMGRGGVVMRMGLIIDSCRTSTVKLARKKGDTYEAVTTVFQNGYVKAYSVGRAELDPGEYHVVEWTCAEYPKTTILGKGDWWGTYKQSYGRFEVHAGEIVNIGAINMIEVAPNTVHLAASEIPASLMEHFKQEFPNLAARMQTRLLEVPVPRLPKAQMAVFCSRINEIHKIWKLPPYLPCLTQPPLEAIVNPERPALWQ
jgi:hypothetical protein